MKEKEENYCLMLDSIYGSECIDAFHTKSELRKVMKNWNTEYKKYFEDAVKAPAIHAAKWNKEVGMYFRLEIGK